MAVDTKLFVYQQADDASGFNDDITTEFLVTSIILNGITSEDRVLLQGEFRWQAVAADEAVAEASMIVRLRRVPIAQNAAPSQVPAGDIIATTVDSLSFTATVAEDLRNVTTNIHWVDNGVTADNLVYQLTVEPLGLVNATVNIPSTLPADPGHIFLAGTLYGPNV